MQRTERWGGLAIRIALHCIALQRQPFGWCTAASPLHLCQHATLAMLPLLLQGGAGRVALFPDTVSDRAQRHVRELTALARAGGAAALVFLVQRDDCTAFAPCHEVRGCQLGRRRQGWPKMQAWGICMLLVPIWAAQIVLLLLSFYELVQLPAILRILFCGCHLLQKDPVYGRLVWEAAAAGVLLLPVACALDPQTQSVRFLGALPLDLEYKWQG